MKSLPFYFILMKYYRMSYLKIFISLFFFVASFAEGEGLSIEERFNIIEKQTQIKGIRTGDKYDGSKIIREWTNKDGKNVKEIKLNCEEISGKNKTGYHFRYKCNVDDSHILFSTIILKEMNGIIPEIGQIYENVSQDKLEEIINDISNDLGPPDYIIKNKKFNFLKINSEVLHTVYQWGLENNDKFYDKNSPYDFGIMDEMIKVKVYPKEDSGHFVIKSIVNRSIYAKANIINKTPSLNEKFWEIVEKIIYNFVFFFLPVLAGIYFSNSYLEEKVKRYGGDNLSFEKYRRKLFLGFLPNSSQLFTIIPAIIIILFSSFIISTLAGSGGYSCDSYDVFGCTSYDTSEYTEEWDNISIFGFGVHLAILLSIGFLFNYYRTVKNN